MSEHETKRQTDKEKEGRGRQTKRQTETQRQGWKHGNSGTETKRQTRDRYVKENGGKVYLDRMKCLQSKQMDEQTKSHSRRKPQTHRQSWKLTLTDTQTDEQTSKTKSLHWQKKTEAYTDRCKTGKSWQLQDKDRKRKKRLYWQTEDKKKTLTDRRRKKIYCQAEDRKKLHWHAEDGKKRLYWQIENRKKLKVTDDGNCLQRHTRKIIKNA